MAYTSYFHSFICYIILNIKLIILPIIFSRSIKDSLGQWTLPYLALILIIPFFIIIIHYTEKYFLKNLCTTSTTPWDRACVYSLPLLLLFFLGEEKRRVAKEGYTWRPMYYTTTLLANPVSSTKEYSSITPCIYYLFIYIHSRPWATGRWESSPELTGFISTGKLTAK